MKLPPDTYIEIKLKTRRKHDLVAPSVLQFLLSHQFSFDEIVQTQTKTTSSWAVYLTSVTRIKHLQKKFETLSLLGVRFQTKLLGPKDWRDKWQRFFHTMPLGKKFTLIPTWEQSTRKPHAGNRTPIYLDPENVFGTGGHATTQLMVTMMESLEGQFDSFLDIGTGSGILSLVAAHLMGAGKKRQSSMALDIDVASVKVAQKNLSLNQLDECFSFHEGALHSLKTKRTYGLVAANMITDILIMNQLLLARFVQKGGFLVLSGIGKRNWERFSKSFKLKGVKRVEVYKRRGWHGLILKRV